MNMCQRINAVINNKRPDVIPYNLDLTSKMISRIAHYYKIENKREVVERQIGNHLVRLEYLPAADFSPKKTKNGITDEFGVVWDKNKYYEVGDWGIEEHPIKNMSLDGYVFPNPKDMGRFEGFEEISKRNSDRFILLEMIGCFDIAWHLCGYEDIFVAMITKPDFVNNILDKALEFNIDIINSAPDFIDGIRIIEDWGKQEGLLMGYKHWKKFLKPRIKKRNEAVKEKGFKVFQHTCGDISKLFPEIVELGIDVIDPVQPEVMDIVELYKNHGKEIVFYGGLGSQSTIPKGSPEDVVKEARTKLSLLGKRGKYILGPAGSIPNETPINNVIALIDFCKNMPSYNKITN